MCASGELLQSKALPGGQVRSYPLDLAAMGACAGWSRRDPGLLAEEVAHLLEAFPTFLAVLGKPLPEEQSWVEAAEPCTCEACGDLIVFDRGCRCVRCERPFPVASNARIGLVGRIPALITGRPFEAGLDRRLVALRRQGHPLLDAITGSLLEAGGRKYLAPRFGLWFSKQFPHSDPPVMVWPEYFPTLDIPPDHVYYAGSYFRLCLFASWREQPAVRVLQNRVAPRLLIDLMVADLKARDRLDDALERLECTLYQLYNKIGRPEEVEGLARVHRELMEP